LRQPPKENKNGESWIGELQREPFSDEGDWCPSEGSEAFGALKYFGERLVWGKNEIALVVTSVKRGSAKLVQMLRA
jgi:hypothetical protein